MYQTVGGKVIVLGSGSSMGVPVAACDCRICCSGSPFNKRLRPSILIIAGGKTLLVDCGPDFRRQALAHNLQKVDGLLLTHTHFDHIAGIDDLRIYCIRKKEPIDCLLSKESLEDLEKRYYYMMHKDDATVARFRFVTLPQEKGSIEFQCVPIQYFTYSQPDMPVTGFRVGSFAYVTDIKQFSEEIFTALKGVDTLILGCHRLTESRMHFNLDQAVEFCQRLKPKRCYLTHMGHEIDYYSLRQHLPPYIEPAFDGLQFSFRLDH